MLSYTQDHTQSICENIPPAFIHYKATVCWTHVNSWGTGITMFWERLPI